MYIENPNPFVFQIGDFGVRWYGLAVAVSMAIGIWYIVTEGKRRGWDEDDLYTVSLLILIFGVVGARAVFVLTNLGYFLENPAHIFRGDGLAWHGALLGGVLSAWIFFRIRGLMFSRAADLAVVGLNVGYVLVRLANITNQEVLGRYSALLGTRHPAQIYGSLIGLALLVRYFVLERHKPPAGYQFWSWFFWYSVLRAVVEETVRTNPLYAWGYVNEYLGFGFFTMTHLATPFLLALPIFFLWRIRIDPRERIQRP
ncbi:MAG: prolipoprotein diacylglyceryl transferase [Bacillota bacterium]